MKYWFYFLILLFSLTIQARQTHAQNPAIEIFGIKEGLPTNTVYDILQDKKGFIWLATEKGLFRYDGKTFKSYQTTQQKSKAGSQLAMDGYDRIWYQAFNGQLFYADQDSLQLFEPYQASEFYFYSFDNTGTKLWCQNNENLMCFDLKSGNKIHSYQKDSELYSWALFRNNEYLMWSTAGNMQNLSKKQKTNYKDGYLVFYIYNYFDKILGIGKSVPPLYLSKLTKDKTEIIYQFNDNLIFHTVKTLPDSSVWVCTNKGAYIFDKTLNPKTVKLYFQEYSICSVMQDNENNYWIATKENGILLVKNLNVIEAPIEDNIISLSHIDNTLYMGTSDNSITTYKNGRFKKLIQYNKRHNIRKIYPVYNEKNSFLVASDVMRIYNIKAAFDIALKDVVYIEKNMYAVASTGNEKVYFHGGYNPKESYLFKKYMHDIQANMNLMKNFKDIDFMAKRVYSVAYSPADTSLYFANSLGIMYITPKEKQYLKYKGQDVIASHICITPRNLLIISSTMKGLFIAKEKKIFKNITTKDGLYSNETRKSIYYKNHLWILFDNVIQKFNLVSDKIETYNINDGINSEEIRDIAVYNDTVYLASNKLIKFPVNLVSHNNQKPSLIVEKIEADSLKNIEPNTEIDLPYYTKNIKINFSLINYRGYNSSTVLYKINNGEWLTLEKNLNVLSLLSLAPNRYQIELKARNEDGVEGNSVFYRFRINPPFWQTWWFVLISILGLIGVTILIYQQRLKEIQEKNKIIEDNLQLELDLQKSMLSSIKSQMNPHFLFNALNTIQSYIYLNDRRNASEYLNRFAQLTRMILDMSNKENISLQEEITALNLYLELESARFETDFEYEIIAPEKINLNSTCLPTMLIQPYVENAIRHGLLHRQGVKKLSIKMELLSDIRLQVVVEDNGIGRQKAAELRKHRANTHQSFSSEANQRRLQILNSQGTDNVGVEIEDLYDTQQQATGTRVTIIIPIIQL
ncbi:Two component regulator propeller [Flexibacter flexilis DSM 6793]|uniref:Two component regulator propeller n=1 Tax=Flexibacter flexilis DSM 6793 TaxID=927664 RepID=A0A1I1D8C6_9BACT|nr:histidine kinase [Flexibacter flexilis]SFB70642.1 Two component regulator propeller [Flexibacter flexilis DSM 6793]